VTTSRSVGVPAVSDERGGIRVLAIDHRDSLRRFLAPEDPQRIKAVDITALKIDIVSALIDQVTGVMLEPEYSIPQITDAGLVPAGVGVIAALESQGYHDDPSGSITTVLDGWSIGQARDAGAAMVKLLLPFRPDAPTAAAQEQVARQIIADSVRLSMPLVLEPLPWGTDSPEDHAAMIVLIAQRFGALGPALLKVPFPGQGKAATVVATQACEAITAASPMPWALLSGGGTFESFEAQLGLAMAAGCSGYMVGRALWGDATGVDPADRPSVLANVVRPRLDRLNAVVAGRPRSS
jgi:tagatose-1,6-bisphosphate aldolase